MLDRTFCVHESKINSCSLKFFCQVLIREMRKVTNEKNQETGVLEGCTRVCRCELKQSQNAMGLDFTRVEEGQKAIISE